MNNNESIKDFASWEFSNKEIYALGLLLFISFLLRVVNLDTLSLWMDEYVHVGHAQRILNEQASILGSDLNGILYTIFVLPFFAIFGESTFWARFPSVIFGVGSVWMTWIVGKEIYNKPVGFISAILVCFSLYHIYWSRLSRNYAIFSFFFLVLIYVVWKLLHSNKSLNLKESFNYEYLKWLPLALLASTLSHLLTVTLVISLAVYFIAFFIYSYIADKKVYEFNCILGVGSFTILLFIFTPYFSGVLQSFLGFFLPEKIVGMISLDWDRLLALMTEEPFSAFLVYWDLLYYELSFGLVIGISGLILSFILSFKNALFHSSLFFVPLLLMSFIFREPNLPRYFIYLYPLFVIFVSVGIVFLAQLVITYLPDRIQASFIGERSLLIVALISLMIPISNARNVTSVVTAENRIGNIVNPALSTWYFTNWKEVLDGVKNEINDNDLIMSTVPGAVKYYLKRDDVIRFRQFNYDGQTKSYEMNSISGDSISAQTTYDLKQTVEKHPKGWLFADYYFYNVLTDQSARNYVYNTFYFHPELSKNGDVQVFSWNNEVGVPVDQNIIIQLSPYRVKSEPYFFDFKNNEKSFRIRVSGIDSNQEAFIIFNEDYDNPIPIPSNIDNTIRLLEGRVNSQLLSPGRNRIELYYNADVESDPNQGFVVYFLEIIDSE